MINLRKFFKSSNTKSSIINLVDIFEVDRVWLLITNEFETYSKVRNRPRMDREELSFHSDVKLLGHLCLQLEGVPGAIVEIGVWKGKSLAFMERLSKDTKIIGIDPCEIEGQTEELNFFTNIYLKMQSS